MPDGVDGEALAAYCLMLGDDALIFSHRLQQWLTRAPELEEETALANIALDLLGQARMLLTRAGRADGTGRSEDDLAFFRAEAEFRNVRLVERVGRRLRRAGRTTAGLLHLATGAARPAAHVQRPCAGGHRRQGGQGTHLPPRLRRQWVVRLGDGTDFSHERMQRGLEVVWPWSTSCSRRTRSSPLCPGSPSDAAGVRAEFDAVIDTVLATAGLDRPTAPALAGVGGLMGRDGRHTEAMGYLLAELQSVARAHPEATW